MTDHMLYVTYDPEIGWSAPEIRPYGPLSLDPASSCFQYCPNVFEGMKVSTSMQLIYCAVFTSGCRLTWDPMGNRASSDQN